MPPSDLSQADIEEIAQRLRQLDVKPEDRDLMQAVSQSAQAGARSADAACAVVAAAAIKISSFWQSQPEEWFRSLESQFELNRITVDATKYHYVINNLPEAVIGEVREITKKPPANGAYNAIKTLLLDLYGRLDMDYAKELVRVRSLNGRSCKAHLSYMRGLVTAPEDAKGHMFRAVFLYSLPLHIRRPYLHSDLTLDDIAKQADAQLFADQSGDLDNAGAIQQVVVSAVDPVDAEGDTPATVDRIGFRGPRQPRTQQVPAPRQPPFRPRTQGPATQQQQQYQPPQAGGFICRNHLKFGQEAFSCRDPSRCIFSRQVAGPPALNSGAGRR